MNPSLRLVSWNRTRSWVVAGLLASLLCGPSCGIVSAKQVVSSETRFAVAKGGSPVPGGKDVIALAQGNKVGYRVMEISVADERGRRSTTSVAVWYPTDDPERPFEYRYDKNTIKTQLAENGKVASGSFPLVVFSHGATGSGLTSAFVTETMARHGFIVAAVDHTDDVYLARIPANWKPAQSRGQAIKALSYALKVRNKYLDEDAVASRPEISYRPAQIRAAIDLLVNASKDTGSPFAGHVDAEKIGVMGHSFGAWTAMAVAGGVDKFADPRVRAAVALSPAVNGQVFSAQEMGHIKAPFMLMYGSKEVQQGRGDDRTFFYDRVGGPKYMVEIKDAEHTTFSGGIREEHPNLQGYLDDANRAAIARYAIAFMSYCLKGDATAHDQLKIRGDAVSNYIYAE
jgi:predicted dienelactone hydrolase